VPLLSLSWNPAPQVNPQAVPLQIAVEFAGGTQAVHEVVPQLFMLPFDTQKPPQSWYPVAHAVQVLPV
jgi:hypothetical protein